MLHRKFLHEEEMEKAKGAVEFTCISGAGEVTAANVGRSMAQSLAKEGRALPSFFIVGPPRTGSSWLNQVLDRHALLPGPLKETRFFDTHFHRGVKWYLAHYDAPAAGRRMGEVAPTYFASALARERMVQLLPSARIVCVFRNPVDRIVSLYRLKRAYGLIPWNFEEAVRRDPELMETSRYASHLKLWQRSFGTANVMACIYDDLRGDPQRFLDEAVDFIGVPRFKLTDWQRGFVHGSENMTHPRNYYGTRSATLAADWLKARRMGRVVSTFKNSALCKLVLGGGPPFPKISKETQRHMSEIFEPEVEELEHLLKRDLSAWKMLQRA
jgi:hypothetical protein